MEGSPTPTHGKVWSAESLDAILLTLWTLLIVGASASILLKEVLSPQSIEFSAQLSVVSFILLSAYRLGVAYNVNMLIWFPASYVLIFAHSFFIRKVYIRTDVFIEHVFYAMMAFVCILAILRVYRYYKRKRDKKRFRSLPKGSFPPAEPGK